MTAGDQCHDMLDVLCPLHVVIGPDCRILNAGPTARKLCPEGGLTGRLFTEVFDVQRPRRVGSYDDLTSLTGDKLHIRLRMPPYPELKGIAVTGPEKGRLTVNLSFGISVVEAIQEYDLTAADFAATDLTIEMLYLIEAKSAAMEASRQLNQRLQAAREAAEEQAVTDALTGLCNRRAMDTILERKLQSSEPFALLHIDLDFFKAVNDTLGHAAGDHVLQEVAQMMTEETRDTDIVARVGGDEFVILLSGRQRRGSVDQVARRIIARSQEPIRFEDETCRISASIGTVMTSDYAEPSADQMLKDADEALYRSKREGRGRHNFFLPDPEEAATSGR